MAKKIGVIGTGNNLHLAFLRIYPDAMIAAIETAESAVEKYCGVPAVDKLNENARAELEFSCNGEDITESVISAYFDEAVDILESYHPDFEVDYKTDPTGPVLIINGEQYAPEA